MNIDLESLDAAELALISKMAHVDPEIRRDADRYLMALVGPTNARLLRDAAQTSIDQVRATDAVLYAEDHVK